ncbi:MAG TPA: hypothetical protein VF230_06430 [Acidimicrobiales bacterium]
MFKRILLLAVAAIVGVLGVGFGAAAEPGPNGNNDHGLCTAYFNGQKNGHGEGEDQTNQPPPFQGLEDASREYTDSDGTDNDNDNQTDEDGENESLTDAENIFNYCHDLSTIGGNPTHGRFTCTDEGGTGTGPDTETDPECNNNEGPGNS